MLILTCENDTSTDKQTLNVTCHSNGSWIPDPADFICSESSFTVPPGSYLSYEEHKLLLLYITVPCMVTLQNSNQSDCSIATLSKDDLFT